jgi:hypothetical protein
MKKGYPEQNLAGVKRFVRLGGAGIGDVVAGVGRLQKLNMNR